MLSNLTKIELIFVHLKSYLKKKQFIFPQDAILQSKTRKFARNQLLVVGVIEECKQVLRKKQASIACPAQVPRVWEEDYLSID